MSNSDANTVEPISRRRTLFGIAGAAAGSIAAASSSNAFATQSLALPIGRKVSRSIACDRS